MASREHRRIRSKAVYRGVPRRPRASNTGATGATPSSGSLLDNSISIDKVIGQFILPEPLTGRPTACLAVEWPWIVHLQQAESLRLSYGGKVYEAAYTDLVPDIDGTGDVSGSP